MNLQNIWEYLLAIVLASMGGLAKLLSKKDKRVLRWINIVSEIFVAAFTGLMTLFALHISGVSGAYIGLLCGLAGWFGPKVLDVLSRFGKNAGVDFDKKDS